MVDARNSPQRITRLTPLADAIGAIDRLVPQVAPRSVDVAAALGCTLAAAVTGEFRPLAAHALRDGWALRSEATLDAGSYGAAPLADLPVAVEVGDVLPAGADAVVAVDAVAFEGGAASALVTVAPGDGVVTPGADAGRDEPLLRVGRRLSCTDLAILRAMRQSAVGVRTPRVRVAAARADIFIDAIAALLCDAIAADGGIAIRHDPGSADAEELDGVVLGEGADAVIVVGGSGTGERDRSVEILARVGQRAFHGVGLAPGDTAAFGLAAGRPILVLPGRFDAALAAWLVLGRRLLARLAARTDDDATRPVRLTRKVSSAVGVADVIVVARDGDGVAPLASGYLTMRALARADGWILVPADAEGYPAGASIAMRPLP
jgi:molybdopterin molybdotransferase